MRRVFAYMPALGLLLAGIVLLVVVPVETPVQCTPCQYNPVTNQTECHLCVTGEVIHPWGPAALLASGIAASVVFAVRHRPRS